LEVTNSSASANLPNLPGGVYVSGIPLINSASGEDGEHGEHRITSVSASSSGILCIFHWSNPSQELKLCAAGMRLSPEYGSGDAAAATAYLKSA